MERLKEFLKQLTKVGKDDLQRAIEYAIQEIIVNKENPRLVKLALGIFLTHSRVAHRLGIVAPSLLHYNEFTTTKDQPLSNPATGETMQGYGLLKYWREDYDFNDHHNHWHMVYPSGGNPGSDGTFYRTIDRQGELFLYMHSQMVARYNAELISWGLYPIATWQYDDIVTYGYTPSPFLIDDFIPRPPNQGWFEMYNPYLPESQLSHYATKETAIKWRDNIFRAIQDGYFITENKKTKKAGKLYLTADNAKNWVGVAVEAESVDLQETSPGSDEFLDKGLYGNLHNLGHNNFASIGYKGGSKFGVMGTNLASPRDPCFWLWHRHIDEFRVAVAKKYSHSLNEFKPEAELQELKIVPQDPKSATPKGSITTFLGPPQLHLFEVNAKVDHEPYQWEITIKSTSSPPASKSRPQVLTVRLFIVPDVLQQDLQAWIEMDKFTHQLEQQETTIIRYDVDSASAVARKTCPEEEDTAQSKWCKCGWPQNMMLPVGKPEGMPFRAFAILTDDKLGKVCNNNSINTV